MKKGSLSEITLPLLDDLHVHLRQAELMGWVVPELRKGGTGRVLVMPNLKPAINSCQQALAYKAELQALDHSVEYLMTLYLNPQLSPTELSLAKEHGVVGIKSYPQGVTTNSDNGIESYETYYTLFEAMQDLGLILNLHGELPSKASQDTCILNAEQRFLPQLQKIHTNFPKLRIVLEHVTTKASVEAVKELGPTVAATITAHHLDLTVDDWAGKNHNFCKPVAKYPSDREALREVVRSGHPKFFLGSDSAPHPKHDKESACACAGVYTSSSLLPYLAHSFEEMNCLERLENFACHFGQQFYGLPPLKETVTICKQSQKIVDEYKIPHTDWEVVPYKAQESLFWTIV